MFVPFEQVISALRQGAAIRRDVSGGTFYVTLKRTGELRDNTNKRIVWTLDECLSHQWEILTQQEVDSIDAYMATAFQTPIVKLAGQTSGKTITGISILTTQTFAPSNKTYMLPPDMTWDWSGGIETLLVCDCGKEKHGFSHHITGCPGESK